LKTGACRVKEKLTFEIQRASDSGCFDWATVSFLMKNLLPTPAWKPSEQEVILVKTL
jgi:hypothetical protein